MTQARGYPCKFKWQHHCTCLIDPQIEFHYFNGPSELSAAYGHALNLIWGSVRHARWCCHPNSNESEQPTRAETAIAVRLQICLPRMGMLEASLA